MSSFKKRKNHKSLLSSFYNRKLTTNNFGWDLRWKRYLQTGVTPLESNSDNRYLTINQSVHNSTCCSLNSVECDYYSNFCSWDNRGLFCSATGQNASSCGYDEDPCCGADIPGLNNNNPMSGDNNQSPPPPPMETRSLADQITPEMVDPGDGVSYSTTSWWKETSNWILRGNRNLNGNFNPVPCALPPIFNYFTEESTCPRFLEKVLDDGNEIITISDWDSILCNEAPDVYCKSIEEEEEQEGDCPIRGDVNNSLNVNISDLVIIIELMIYNNCNSNCSNDDERESQIQYFIDNYPSYGYDKRECFDVTLNVGFGISNVYPQLNILTIITMVNILLSLNDYPLDGESLNASEQLRMRDFLELQLEKFLDFIQSWPTADYWNENNRDYVNITRQARFNVLEFIAHLHQQNIDSPF